MISVVIIDDNKPMTDRIFKTIPWEKLGCEVVALAYNGMEGKKAITQYLPDLIITDIKMPRLDGLEVIDLTRALIPSSRVIFITAYDEFDYAYRAIKLQAFDYLIKPFSQASLLKTIQKAVSEISQNRLAEKLAAASADGAAVEPAEAGDVIDRALEYIQLHLADGLTLEAIANHFDLNTTYLGRLIKQKTGRRYTECLTRMRMEKARKLLENKEYRVAEIAEMVGYKGYLSFYKVFSKEEGISPTDYYRKVHEAENP